MRATIATLLEREGALDALCVALETASAGSGNVALVPARQVSPFYALHAWIWRKNPSGMLAPYNPEIAC